jgi:Spy/CpxP family protein refolding chaperone
MKNYVRLFIPFLLAMVLGSLTVIFAQSSKDSASQTRTDNTNFTVPPPPPPGFGPHGGPGGGLPPHLLEQLDLTDEQITRIGKLRDDSFTTGKTYFDKLRTTDNKLRELSQPDAFDEAQARQALAVKAQAMTELELIRLRTDAQIYGVLTPEQIMQLEQLKEKVPHGRPMPPPDGFGSANGFPPPDGFGAPKK